VIQTTKDKLATTIRAGFLPILVNDTLDPLFLAEICLEAGLPAIEYSLRRTDIRQMLPRLKTRFPELILLAASTIDDDNCVSFLKKKRDFLSLDELYRLNVDGIVSMLPFRQETYKTYGEEWLFVPGVETAAEALQQLRWGGHLIKFFNAEVFGGPRRIRTLQGPSHGIFPIVVTGGMTRDMVLPYMEGSALALAAGFDIILGERYQEMQETPDKTLIRSRLEGYVNAVAETRAKLGQSHWAQIKDADALLIATGRYFPFQAQSAATAGSRRSSHDPRAHSL